MISYIQWSPYHVIFHYIADIKQYRIEFPVRRTQVDDSEILSFQFLENALNAMLVI